MGVVFNKSGRGGKIFARDYIHGLTSLKVFPTPLTKVDDWLELP